jgi:hypothetical protein
MTVLRFRPRPQQDDNADAEARYWDRIGDLFGLEETASTFIAPLVQVGWMEFGQGSAGTHYCLRCTPIQPMGHVPVYAPSIFSQQPCRRCGRPLTHVLRP